MAFAIWCSDVRRTSSRCEAAEDERVFEPNIALIVVTAVAVAAIGLVIAAGVRRRLERAAQRAAEESHLDEERAKRERDGLEHGPRAIK
jgi:uncharacterized oligopeptide transporter (OPT) family protein